MIRITVEGDNGSHKEWTFDSDNPELCPFKHEDLVESPRVTFFSEDHLVVLADRCLFVTDIFGGDSFCQLENVYDREVVVAMILCALHPDGETDWDYEEFEEILDRYGIERFIP
jgi:hypothetical protein